MTTGTRCAALPALVIALAGFVAGCSGGGDADSGTETTAQPPGTFRTLGLWAGSADPGGPGDADGIGSAARFGQPEHLAMAADGSLWITESGAKRIRRMGADGQVTTLLDVRSTPITIDAGERRLTLASPGAVVATPSGGAFVAMKHVFQATAHVMANEASWAVLHVAPGSPPRVVALPAPAESTILSPSALALALDRQGRLYIAAGCSLWRTDGDVLSATGPRAVVKVHEAAAPRPGDGSTCALYAAWNAVTRLAFEADESLLFTLSQGDMQRLAADGQVTTVGRASDRRACGGMVMDAQVGLLHTDGSPGVRMSASNFLAGSPQETGWFDGIIGVARFHSLCGIAIDGQGRIVVADTGNHTIRRIARDNTVTTIAGLAPQWGYRDAVGPYAVFGRSFKLGQGEGGSVLVADGGNTAVREIDARQRVSTLAGGPRAGSQLPQAPDGPMVLTRLDYPSTALKARDGSVWINEGSRVRRLGTDGIIRTVSSAISSMESARTLALDRAGDVVVAWGVPSIATPPPAVFHRLERLSVSNPQATPVPLPLTLPEALAQQTGPIAIDSLCALPDGSLAFTQGQAVLRRAPDGTAALLAGSPKEAGAQDGPGTAARFNTPRSLACDAAGGIYVADTGNHTVRYIDAQRNVRTVLGTAGRAGHRVDALPGELSAPDSIVLLPDALVVATGQGVVRAGF